MKVYFKVIEIKTIWHKQKIDLKWKETQKYEHTDSYVINMKFQTNGEIQIYVFSFPFSKNLLSKDNLPGITLGMRETAVNR